MICRAFDRARGRQALVHPMEIKAGDFAVSSVVLSVSAHSACSLHVRDCPDDGWNLTRRQIVIDDTVNNSPYHQPFRHFGFADNALTDPLVTGWRSSSYFVPIAATKKRAKVVQLGPGGEYQDQVTDKFRHQQRPYGGRRVAVGEAPLSQVDRPAPARIAEVHSDTMATTACGVVQFRAMQARGHQGWELFRAASGAGVDASVAS